MRDTAVAVDFSGKSIDMVIGNPPGGGTDGAARLVSTFLEKYLPGHPTFVMRHMPGAQGVIAFNYVFQQTKRDGLTLMLGSNSAVNPLVFRKGNAVYDPAKFRHIGALGRGGTVLMINREAEKRLYDRSAAPVNYGVIDATRPSAQTAMWGAAFLGWNIKWVGGYRGGNDTTLALERGEVDMVTTGNLFLTQRLASTGRFKVQAQMGTLEEGKYVPRPEFSDAPVLHDLVHDKLDSDIARQAFAYWESAEGIDKWVALSDGTSDDIVATYRDAFQKMVKDPEFVAMGKKISEDLEPMNYRDMEMLSAQMAGVTQATDDYITGLLRKQGATVGK
jgi:tripartite-type tricarboxylate transporter receptor subunit TctC